MNHNKNDTENITTVVSTNTQTDGVLSSRRFMPKAEVDNEAGKKTKAIIVTKDNVMVRSRVGF